MATSEASDFGVQFLFDLRIVLLGNRAAGKTSLANLITGHAEPHLRRTAQCVKMHGDFAGRQVIVVDTPGWWKNYLVKETPEFQKQEIVLSVAHCPPGPHAILLVIRVDALFKEKHRRSAQEHLELLSERVWNHTIVVFTYRDQLQEQVLGKHIGSEGESLLLWLVEKCGHRYHVLNTERATGTQLTGLLEKIDAMVVGNGSCLFEMDRLHEVEGMMTKRYMRANQRRKMVQEQWGTPLVRQGHKHVHISKMRMIVLGFRRAGKSSAGNTILSMASFISRAATTTCVRRQGDVNGRNVTVVDTPGWWKSLPVIDTPELDKEELLFSVSLCPPGPHVLLLTLRVDMSFTPEEKESVAEHMELLGERVWAHTIVLFTHGDCLGDVTVEEFIESEGEALQWLIEKCGNRYHVLNNENWDDGSQVTNLLEKIEKMVAQNRGHYYEIDPKTLKEVKQKWKAAEKKAKARAKKQRQMRKMKTAMKDIGKNFSELCLVLLGYGESGKSSTGNSILGQQVFGSRRTARCVQRHGEVGGQQVNIIDTPGWWKHLPIEQTPELNKDEISQSVSLSTSGPVAFILVVRVDCSFKEQERKAMVDHLRLLGSTFWDHSIVLFTFGDLLGDRAIEQHIECEGTALQWLVDRCGNRYHVFNNKARGESHQVRELLEKIQEMIAANRGCDDMDMQVQVEEEDRANTRLKMQGRGEEDEFDDSEENEVFLESTAWRWTTAI
ncbi:GTPase IMAP family member 8 [Rhinichthys klamathensis goyatoka]|uniref:GTPase IMAP family member 8 n=1 Tax=Rhinichthys klamathensis goyatoka TaxID=3034132 RepID=UPI0024B55AF5|nr:GTPase IMAP family member 8 [Rhinichthys klamathensis goyatoka]